ncbi:hypothetical protein [Faecalibacterium hominis (ex Afrizal et al. 2022)]|uniref:hypothetical protein n=1 Tax=Faecalibacterium hominis (ex Afrizal et al. 2022) TaxID=2881265 RepID=UPI003C2B9E54
MKKRLLSLLVALCMAVTLLPVSALTAWAEGGDQLKIADGYPVGSGDNHDRNCSGKGWSYDASTQTLTLDPSTPTTYDLTGRGSIRLDSISILCSAIIGKHATIENGDFWDIRNPSITNYGTITSGVYDMPVINHGTITGGLFSSSVSNESEGKIENGTFESTVTNNGTIKGGIFQKKPEGGTVASGYTLNVNFPKNGSYESFDTGISYFGNSGYVIPNSDHDTSITIYIFFRNRQAILFPIDVTFGDTNDTHCLLEDWAPNASHYDDGMGYFSVTFTAPPATADTVTLSILTRLVIDENGYPVGTKGGTQDYSGNGWKFEKSNKKLTLESGDYDFSGEENALAPLNPSVQLVVEPGAKLAGGAFAKEPKGAGTFKTVTLNGTGSITAVNGLASGDWGNTLYVVKTGSNTITASESIRDINRILFENDDSLYPDLPNKKTVCINIESLNSVNALDSKADIILNQASHGLPLIMDSDGTPVIGNAPFEAAGGFYTYYGDGWHIQKSFEGIGRLYLTGRKTDNSYNFRFTDPVKKTGQLDAVKCSIINEGSTIEDGVFNALAANGLPYSTSSTTPTIKGGTFAAGLYYNNGEITGGAFNGKDSILTHETVLSGNYRSVTVNGGAIVKVNDTFPLVPGETGLDLVQGSAWNLYSYAGTVLTVKADADITNINGQEIGKAFSSIYPNGETDKTVVRFEMPDSDVVLNAPQIIVPDPKPEPTPDPTPETYTLTVKGGTFTYNGGEAMTSASVPVDAEVKVTLNQSAVPEGMVFDLWAMDEASLLGNPAVAYNEESFTIPAGSVAKGSTVTVEAQYRDATIESEPSILGTAAIIGVAGAGTAVIVWQGYRIGMELYEKYFQPTPEEDAVVEPTLESQMTDPIS